MKARMSRAPAMMGDDRDQQSSRDRVAAWMKDVLAERRWSARAWAARAGVSPTTITRAIAEVGPLTSMSTVEKLAQAAGRWPDSEWIANRAETISANEVEVIVGRLLKTLNISALDARTLSLLSRASAIGIERFLRISHDASTSAPQEIAAYDAARWLIDEMNR
jgi:AraC-like DNA-binding protein